MYLGITGVGRYTSGSPGLLALPGYIGTEGFTNITNAVIGSAIALVVSFVAALILGFQDPKSDDQTDSGNETGKQAAVKDEVLCAPVKGKSIPIEDVADPTFAEKILGTGAAIVPQTGLVVSPADAKVDTLFETNHAISLTTEGGAELLIHIGIDTVKLKGKHFKPMVSSGDSVKLGQPLIEFDLDKIKEDGYDTTTIMVVTNHGDYTAIERNGEEALEKQPFLTLKGRNS